MNITTRDFLQMLYIHLLILRCKMFVGTPKPVNCIRQMQAEQAQR